MSVHAEVEQLEGLKRRLSVRVSEDTLSEAYGKKLDQLTKNMKLPGFRPGKVPTDVIEKRHGKDLLNEVAAELMESSFREALTEHNLNLAGEPKVEPSPFEKNKPIEYSATFEVFPEIVLADLEGTPVEQVTIEVTEQDEADAITRLCKQHAQWAEVDRAAANGDRLVFDFVGSMNGEPFEGGSSEGFTLELGSKQMIPGFEDSLVGFAAGDERDIEVDFPESYPVKDLAGKPGVFHITAHKVEEAVLPEFNDELAEKLGVDGGVDVVREELRKILSREAERVVKNTLHGSVAELLLSKNSIDVPDVLVDAEIKHLQSAAMQQGKQKMPDLELPKEPYVEEATKRVVLGLLLAEVIKVNELQLDQDKVRERMLEMFSSHPNPQEIAKMYQENAGMRSQLESQVLEEQAIECLLEKADINTVTKAYAEVMNVNKDG